MFNLTALAGEIAMTTSASTAPVSDRVKMVKATPRVGRFIHSHVEKIARTNNEMMTKTVGSEKPPKIKEKKKVSGYTQWERRDFSAEKIERKMDAAR